MAVNITTDTNTVKVTSTSTNNVKIVDNRNNTSVSVSQPTTRVIKVATVGPQGPTGAITNTGSFATTGSNTFIGNQTVSGSITLAGGSKITNQYDYPSIDIQAGTGGYVELLSNNQSSSFILTNQNVVIATSGGAWIFGENGTTSYPANVIAASFTGSLQGTASFAISSSNAETASYLATPALTNGSVLFSNGTTIAQDNSNLFWDDINNVLGIGTASPNTSSILDLTSTTRGFLIPRMTTTQKNAIASPASGLVVYDTDLKSIANYNGNSWVSITANAPNQQAYTGTITWTGTTAPSGTANHSYNWTLVNNLVTLKITLVYATIGASLTAVTVTLPTDCPAPLKPTGLTTASNNLYTGNAYLAQLITSTSSIATRTILRSNAANNGFEIVSNSAAGAFGYADIIVQYFTS